MTPWQLNKVLYEWGSIVGILLTQGLPEYKISGMFLEFENTASPGDPVSPPTLTRGSNEGIEYYNSLAGNPLRDYLRVPLTAAMLQSSDETNFPKGNQAVFFAQSQGVAGVHGRSFSAVNNSTVFGGALVSIIDETDATRDLVLSRFYLDTDKQQLKLDSSQIGLEWILSLT